MKTKTFQNIVEDFKRKKDKNKQAIHIHHLAIKQGDKSFIHSFTEENKAQDIRSISKSILTVVLGIVIKQAQGGRYPKIDEDSLIYHILKNTIQVTNQDNLAKLKRIKIKHLLTHTIGYEDILLMRGDIQSQDPYSLLNYTINYPILHEPGKHYLYSNAGFYLLSVLLEEFLQEDLMTFIKRELFQPLGISSAHWEKYGNYLAGATRLWLTPQDLLAFGDLLINKGQVDHRQIVSQDWIEKMIQPYIHTKDVDNKGAIFRRHAYGYGIWLPKDPDFYFAHGTDGQILVLLPKKRTIILTQAEQEDITAIEELINDVITSLK